MSGYAIAQALGSALILISFVAAQANRMSQNSQIYLTFNLVGSVLLGVSAVAGAQWGFLALEVVWTAVSAYGLAKSMRSARGDR